MRDNLKTFHSNPFGVYVVACRFRFLEEAREAAEAGNAQSVISVDFREEVRHISSTDVLRWVQFVQDRELQGLDVIEGGGSIGGT